MILNNRDSKIPTLPKYFLSLLFYCDLITLNTFIELLLALVYFSIYLFFDFSFYK